MKKSLIFLLLLFCASNLQAQSKKIKFYEKSGTVLSYDISAISTINFSHNTSKWPTYEMEVFYDSSMQEYQTNIVDSIKFVNDTTRGEAFSVYLAKSLDAFPLSHLDSIRFAPAPHPPRLTSNFKNADVEFIQVKYLDNLTHDYSYGLQQCAVWFDSVIYCSEPIVSLVLDDSLRVIKATEVEDYGPLFMRLNTRGDHVLSVASAYPDVSMGWLEDDDLLTGTYLTLDSGKNNSSAVYVPGTDNIIYYSYGSYSSTNTTPTDAGYYLLDRSSGTKTLILHHISSLGPAETVNGFDISPDGKKLLVPSTGYNRMPLVIEYNLTSHESDTLKVPFNTSYDRWALWLRYNHDGSKILYSSYPINSIQGEANDSSEVGIIDRITLSKQVLNVNPLYGFPTVCVFPEWSPDETEIVYCVGGMTGDPVGYVNISSLFILKTLH